MQPARIWARSRPVSNTTTIPSGRARRRGNPRGIPITARDRAATDRRVSRSPRWGSASRRSCGVTSHHNGSHGGESSSSGLSQTDSSTARPPALTPPPPVPRQPQATPNGRRTFNPLPGRSVFPAGTAGRNPGPASAPSALRRRSTGLLDHHPEGFHRFRRRPLVGAILSYWYPLVVDRIERPPEHHRPSPQMDLPSQGNTPLHRDTKNIL